MIFLFSLGALNVVKELCSSHCYRTLSWEVVSTELGDICKWGNTEIITLDLRDCQSKYTISGTHLTRVRNSSLVIEIHILEDHSVIFFIDCNIVIAFHLDTFKIHPV